MRAVPLGIAILFVASRLSWCAAETGVPAGWSALQYDNFGNDLLNKGQYAQSRKYFDAAIRIEPSRWTAYYNRATAFRMEKNWPAAIKDLNETIRLKPAFFEASWARALTYEAMGDYAAAIRDFNVLEKVTYQVGNPYEMALTLNQRAWIRAACPNGSLRDGKAAVEDAKKACDLVKWKRAQYIDTLAAAYAELGDFDSAVRYEQQAIDLNRSGKDDSIQKTGDPVGDKVAVMMANKAQQFLPGYLKRLELYKQHRPWHDAK
jgi:tetratricopeptide (TPR) repeat protein